MKTAEEIRAEVTRRRNAHLQRVEELRMERWNKEWGEGGRALRLIQEDIAIERGRLAEVESLYQWIGAV